ncbi:MAG: hypothetical protein IKD93_01280 [Firmicutes bacterium]|nr:hypothetical protein [Bacillota bacterium]
MTGKQRRAQIFAGPCQGGAARLVPDEIGKEEASSSAAAPDMEETPDIVDHPSAPSFISVKELLDLVKGDAAKYVPQYGGEKPWLTVRRRAAAFL